MYVPGNLSQSERRFLEQKVQSCANLVLRTSQRMENSWERVIKGLFVKVKELSGRYHTLSEEEARRANSNL